MLVVFKVIGVVVPILVIIVFVFVFFLMFSPKLRGKLMSRQIKSFKHMTDYSKEDMESIISNMGNVSINSKKQIIDSNKEKLKSISNSEAYIQKDAIKTKVKAIKDGLSDNMYCKYCGKLIDSDSLFCKSCGKKVL